MMIGEAGIRAMTHHLGRNIEICLKKLFVLLFLVGLELETHQHNHLEQHNYFTQ